MISKITIEHVEDCRAVASVHQGTWSTPWHLPRVPEFRWLSAMADKRGDNLCWVVLKCNSTNCVGECLVLERAIAELGAAQ